MRQDRVWHTQMFRNGAIEYATTDFLNDHCIDAFQLQVNLVKVLSRFLSLLKSLGIAPPVTAQLTLLNLANFSLRLSEGWQGNAVSEHQIDRERVMLPEIIVDDFNADIIASSKPLFDCLWNAAGLERCAFYRQNGVWILDPSWLDPPNTH
jgi:hypothetical protein